MLPSFSAPILLPPVPLNIALATHGDSITSNGFGGNFTTPSFRSWGAWAANLSKRRFYLSAGAGAAGYTTQQLLDAGILALMLRGRVGGVVNPPWGETDVIKPGMVAILAGTNDVGASVPPATTLANLAIMYRTCLAAGVRPIACTIPPREGGNTMKVLILNAGIQQQARQFGIPCADFYTALVDPDTNIMRVDYQGMGGDTIHPNGKGNMAMGQALVDALSFLPVNAVPTFVAETAQSWANGLCRTDATADGFPDGWSNAGLGGNITTALNTVAGITGKVLKLTVTSEAGGYMRSPVLTVTAGNWLSLMYRWRGTPAGTSPQIAAFIRPYVNATGNAFGGVVSQPSVDGALPTVTDFLDHYSLVKIPPGVTGVWLEVIAHGLGTTVEIAQTGVQDLSASGLAIQ